MRDHRAVIGIAAFAVVAVMAALFLMLVRGGGDPAEQAVPAPTHTAQPSAEAEEEAVTATREVRIEQPPTSNRDPFASVIEPTPEASSEPTSEAGTKTSSDPATGRQDQAEQAKQADRPEGRSIGGSTTKESKDKPKEPKGKAPIPVGGSAKDEQADGTDVLVVDVREAISIVRVNDARTTLYLGVPDASGVTFSASLGGGCGLFSLTGKEDLFTICKGETRQL